VSTSPTPSRGAAIASVIETSRTDARTRGHAEVREEHLVACLLQRADIVAGLSAEAICLVRVEEEVEARLAAIPSVAGYRDVKAVVLARSADEAVERARPRGIFGFLREAQPWDLLASIRARTALGAIVDGMRWETAPIERLRQDAESFATERRHRNVLLEHAVVALLDTDERFMTTVRVLGHDPTKVRRRLRNLIGRHYRSLKLAPLPALIKLAGVHSNVARLRTLGIASIVVSILRYDQVGRALDKVKVSRPDLIYAYVHGAPAEPLPRGGGDVQVVFHNDHFSTTGTVIHVLKTIFDYDDERAHACMAAIHLAGSSVIGTMSGADAADRVQRARALCRDVLMPLRIETRDPISADP
jgi:ATP-dependent Clp protease adapter protein ClpS